MSEYRTGTVNVTAGSPNVVLVGGAAIAEIASGNLFSVVSETLNGAGVLYTVSASPVADDAFTISPVWAGTTATAQAYAIHRDFSPGGAPLWMPGDANVPALYNRLITLIENGTIGGGGGGGGAGLPTFIGNSNKVLTTNTEETGAEWHDHRFVLDSSVSELAPTSVASRLAHYSSLSGTQSLTDRRVSVWNDLSGSSRHATADLVGPIAVGRVGRASYGLGWDVGSDEEVRMIATVPANASTMFFFAIARCGPPHDVNRNLFKTAHASGPPDTQVAGDIELGAISSGNGLQFRVSTSAAMNQLVPIGPIKNGKPFAVAISFSSGTVLGWVWNLGAAPVRISTTYQHGSGFNSDRVRLGSSVDANYNFTLHELLIASAAPTEGNMQRLLLWAMARYTVSDIADEPLPRVYAPMRVIDWPIIGAQRATLLTDGEDIFGFYGQPSIPLTTPGEVTISTSWSRALLRHTGNGALTVNLPNTIPRGYEVDLEQKPGTTGTISLVLTSGATNENAFSLVVRSGRRLSLRVAENSNGVSARYASYVATVYNQFAGVDAPTINDDELAGYELGSLHFDTAGGGLYFCRDPSAGAAVWVPLSTAALGALSSLDAVPGNRLYLPHVELNAASGNVTHDPSGGAFYVLVSGHSVARNLDLTPAPGSTLPSSAKLIKNDGSANLVVRDHAAATIITIAAGEAQLVNWNASDWDEGWPWPGGAGGGGGGGLTTFDETLAAVDVGDGGTLTASSHGEFYTDSTTLRRRKVRFRHASNPASAVTVTVQDGLSQRIEWHVASDQTGLVTLNRQTSATINGGTSVQLATAGASGIIIPIASNTYRLKGDTREVFTLNSAIDASGNALRNVLLESELLQTPASSSGTLTVSYAAGNQVSVTLSENITTHTLTNVPTTGRRVTLTYRIIQGASNFTMVWPSGTDWGTAGAPTLSAGSGSVTVVTLISDNGGTTWYGILAWSE